MNNAFQNSARLNSLKVLLVDTTAYEPASPLFAKALATIGVPHLFFDEAPFLRPLKNSLAHRLAFHLLHRRPITQWKLNRMLLDAATSYEPEVVLVVKGTYVTSDTLKKIRERTRARLINFATDDPFNAAVSNNFIRNAIPEYDLYACTKKAIMSDVRRAGCGAACFVGFGYKPEIHFPECPATEHEARRFGCDVVFIGGADADRIPWFEPLSRQPGLRLALYGGFWERHPSLGRKAHGEVYGREYRLALCSAKIAIGMVRKANRDGHAMRTFEIPACGAFMLAERTEEHQELFKEDVHAAFFGSPEELRDKISFYLAHDSERERIARAGYWHVRSNPNTYADRLLELFNAAASAGCI
jgi:spore maturation protein CgeB